jgi:hypothetical protein
MTPEEFDAVAKYYEAQPYDLLERCVRCELRDSDVCAMSGGIAAFTFERAAKARLIVCKNVFPSADGR